MDDLCLADKLSDCAVEAIGVVGAMGVDGRAGAGAFDEGRLSTGTSTLKDDGCGVGRGGGGAGEAEGGGFACCGGRGGG